MIILKGIAALIIILICGIFLIGNLIISIIALFKKDTEIKDRIAAAISIIFTVAIIIYIAL